MLKLKERDEQEALKLDECYKDAIERVRPLIIALNLTEDKHLCQAWLQKLTSANDQRPLRNQYLLKLYNQLQTGSIGCIFSNPPPKGALSPLSKCCNCEIMTSSSISELSDTTCTVPHDIPKPIMKHRNESFSSDQSSDSSSTNYGCEIVENSPIRYCAKSRSDRYSFLLYKKRIESLAAQVYELQIEKEQLKRSLSNSNRNCDYNEHSQNLTSTIEQLTLEITTLRTKLIEVNHMKDELEKNHREIVEQYKSTMTKEFDHLNSRLQEARSKNEELDDKVATISGQLEKIMLEKKEELIVLEENFKERLETVRLQWELELSEKDKELILKNEIINEKDGELATREKFYRDEIALLNDRIHVLEDKLETKMEDEDNLQSFLKEQCSTMKEEFMKMRNDMEVSARSENQTLVDKISSLKKIIMKLVKSKEKQSIEFENKMAQILKTKDLEIKHLELQLQEQQNELSANLSTEKQGELDSLVRLLEERYKALLAATDESVGNQRQHFLKKITFLESQVTCMKNNLVDGDLYV